MTQQTIVAGETTTITDAFDLITIDGGAAGGGAGGTGLIETSLSDPGVIKVHGGAPASTAGQAAGQAGTLDISGAFDNGGTVALAGGAGSDDPSIAGGTGAVLTNTGVLTNAGALNIGAGLTGFSYGARYPFNYGGQSGLGAVLINNGTLDNSGTMTLGGGEGSGYYSVAGGTGGALTNTGVLVNTGAIKIGGGLGGYYDGGNADSQGGLGAVLTNDGTLSNQGTLTIFGSSSGKGAESGFGYGGTGGTLDNAGVLSNSGTLSIDGGLAGSRSHIRALFIDPTRGLGGDLINSGTLENSGSLVVKGGQGDTFFDNGGTGGTLDNTGVLINSGTIAVIGGHAGIYGYPGAGQGGQLLVDDGGVLTNSGRINVRGGFAVKYPGYTNGYGYGSAGTLTVSGSLDNTGTIVVGAGAPHGSTFDVPGGVMLDGGTLTNEALLQINGGTGATAGGSLDVTGVLIDSGTIAIGAGSPNGGLLDNSGTLTVASGGVIADAGTLLNTGSLVLDGGLIKGPGLLDNTGTISGSGTIVSQNFVNAGFVGVASGMLRINASISSGTGGHGTFAVSDGATLDLNGSTVSGSEKVNLAGTGAVLQVGTAVAGIAIFSPHGGTLDILGSGNSTLAAGDTHLTVTLAHAGDLTLSTMSFITAIGSTGADTITALAAGQTLTGGNGLDTLIGSAATGDVFRDTGIGLNGDTIVNFAGTDAIDVTTIADSGVALGYAQNGDAGTLTVANGTRSTNITLAGSFSLGDFSHDADASGNGVLIQLGG